MAKIEDVVRQLQAILPKYTDYFNDSHVITNIVNTSGNIFRITTATPHLLATGDYVNIDNVLTRNLITTVVNLGSGNIKLTTTVSHDLTQDFQTEVYISGFTNIPNGYYPIVLVNDINIVTVTLPAVPIGTGYINENRVDSINGRYIITLVDATNFDITCTHTSFTTFFLLTTSKIISNIRITGIGSPQRFIEYYTEKTDINDYWIFVTSGASATSFSRKIESDANQRIDKTDSLFFEIVQPIQIYVIAPTTTTFGARFIRDVMTDIRKYLCKSLVGVQFPSGFDTEEERFLVTFTGDDFFQYVGAYYIHEFTFEHVYNFYSGDAIEPLDTRAFREFEVNFKLNFDNYVNIKKTVKGDLV